MNVKEMSGWENPTEKKAEEIREKILDSSGVITGALEADAKEKEDRAVIEAKKQWIHSNGFVIKGGFMSERAFEKAIDAAQDARERADQARADQESAKAALLSSDAFTDQGVAYTEYMSTAHDLSIADYCGRFLVDKEKVSFPVEPYSYTDCAEVIPEGGEAGSYDITDYIGRVKTDNSDTIQVFDILKLPEKMYNDDQKTMDQALASAHNKRIINRENAAALAMLIGVKDAIEVDPESAQRAINEFLCPVAKSGAEIWTNKAGFAALDIEIEGVSLIRKNSNGEFIYKSKYIVREFPAEIFPNTDQGAPVLIGDFKNIIRFAVLFDETAEKRAIFPADMLHREIVKEIPLMTTKSDSAYINGYIAVE